MSNIVAEMTPWDVIEAIKLVAYVIGICKAAVSIYVLLAKLASWIQKKLTTYYRTHTPSKLLTLFREKIATLLLKKAFFKKTFSPAGDAFSLEIMAFRGKMWPTSFLKKTSFRHGEIRLSLDSRHPYFKKILSFT